MNRSFNRNTDNAIGAILLATALWAVQATPTLAQTPLVDCQGDSVAHFKPGLTNEAQTVRATATVNYLTCVPIEFAPASENISGTSQNATCEEANFENVSGKIEWNNGETSIYSATATRTATLVHIAGRVIAGLFKDAILTEDISVLADPTACTSEDGLTAASGVGNLHIEEP